MKDWQWDVIYQILFQHILIKNMQKTDSQNLLSYLEFSLVDKLEFKR